MAVHVTYVHSQCFRSFRWATYKQFTWLVHGKLGRWNRVRIPTCVVNRIRETFPRHDTDPEYENYHSLDDSE